MEDPLRHLRLIGDVAKKYRGLGHRFGLDLEDLTQEGWFGLTRACQLFDPDRERKFSTYADYWIKDAIKSAIRRQARPIRVPLWVRTKIRKGATPDDPGLKPNRRECIWAAIRVLEAQREDEGLLCVAEEPEHTFATVAPRLEELGERDRQVISLRFGLDGGPPLSRPKIGRALSLTVDRVRTIEVKALERLREPA